MPRVQKTASKDATGGGCHNVAPEGPHASNVPERRKLRNRMSQRAFRARQSMRIQELEDRLAKSAVPDVAWATQLQEQNAQLREQLLQVYKKANSTQIAMKALADAAAQALGINIPTSHFDVGECDVQEASVQHSQSPEHVNTAPLDTLGHNNGPENITSPSTAAAGFITEELAFGSMPEFVSGTAVMDHQGNESSMPSADGFDWSPPNFGYFPGFVSEEQHASVAANQQGRSAQQHRPSFAESAQSAAQSLPLVPSNAYPLGLPHYPDLRERATSLCVGIPTIKRTNSSFSDHIDALEACLANQRLERGFVVIQDKHLLNAIEFMITAFISISYSQLTSWETHTRALTALKDLTAWKMDRNLPNWQRVVPQYRPTKLQLSVAHPSVIDWIPWPSLRDKLIIHHSANPKLDDVIKDVGKAYVVQADLSTLVRCPQSVVGYVPVYDLVQAASADDEMEGQFGPNQLYNDNSTRRMSAYPFDIDESRPSAPQNNLYQSSGLPAGSAIELFESPPLAKAAHRLLRLEEGAAFNYRLDPSFFELHPELYDPEANVIAHGVRLRPNDKIANQPYPIPGVLDSAVVSQYRECSRIALDYVTV